MNKKLKGLLACFMCVCSVGGIMTGCGNGMGKSDLGEVELPHFSYENTALDGKLQSRVILP